MKKLLKVSLAVLLSLGLLTGCAKEEKDSISKDTEAGTWKDGVYTENARGKYGTFEVSVTIENGDIAAIDIGDNHETPSKGGVAINTLPDEIIEAQSSDVDVVSGATITSQGIIDAVQRCLEQASQS